MRLDIRGRIPDPGVDMLRDLVGSLRERYQKRRLYLDRVDWHDSHFQDVREFQVAVRGPASPSYAPALPPGAPWWVLVHVPIKLEVFRQGAMIGTVLAEVLNEARLHHGWDSPVFRIGRGAKRLTK